MSCWGSLCCQGVIFFSWKNMRYKFLILPRTSSAFFSTLSRQYFTSAKTSKTRHNFELKFRVSFIKLAIKTETLSIQVIKYGFSGFPVAPLLNRKKYLRLDSLINRTLALGGVERWRFSLYQGMLACSCGGFASIA